MLSRTDKANFSTLQRAVKHGDCCLVECKRLHDGAVVSLVCAANFSEGHVELVPVAELLSGNPYTAYLPPDSQSPSGFKE